jgi:hypothetical protein
LQTLGYNSQAAETFERATEMHPQLAQVGTSRVISQQKCSFEI